MNMFASVDKKQFGWWEGETNPPAFKVQLCAGKQAMLSFFSSSTLTKRNITCLSRQQEVPLGFRKLKT
jgi:hypothetical protein